MNEVCSGSKYALVRMEHEGELIQFRSNYPPVSWETEEVEKIDENKKYYVFGKFNSRNFSLSNTLGGCRVTRWWRTFIPIFPPISNPFVDSSNNRWSVNNPFGDKTTCVSIRDWQYNAKVINAINGRYSIQNRPSGCANTTGGAYGIQVSIDFLTVADGSPPSFDCRVKISDTRGLVYNKVFEETCPEISHFCQKNECPPDTCAVDCGDHICCYDNRGIAVQTIAK